MDDGAESGGDLWRMRGNSTPLALYPTPTRAPLLKINIRGTVGGYFIYPVPLHVLHTEWRVIKEWEWREMPCQRGCYLSLRSTPTERVGESSLLVAFLDLESKGFIIGNFCGEWNSDNMTMAAGRKKGGMNGLGNWPHFYFNVAEVGIIIGRGGGGGATLLPLLIDVLFSTLDAVTRPKSNARAHNHHLHLQAADQQRCRKCTFIRGGDVKTAVSNLS